jgi:hemerythrin superfamily protein
MPASKKSASSSKSSSAGKSSGGSDDAIKLLTADHKEVKALFKEYEKLVKDEAADEDKQALAEEICTMLTVHATAEEELFYPAARDALGDDEDLIDEADVEHSTAKELIAQIQGSSPDDPHYDAKVKVLGEYIDHHVKEEEGEIFPKVKKGGLDTAAIGAEIAARKEELMAEMGHEESA